MMKNFLSNRIVAWLFNGFVLCSFQAQADLASGSKKILDLSASSNFGYIDNFFYNPKSGIGTTYLALDSRVNYIQEYNKAQFTFDGQGKVIKFNRFNQDDHIDYNLYSQYKYSFSHNQLLTVHTSLSNDYLYQGEGYTLGNANKNKSGDNTQNLRFNLGYEYGSQASKARLKFVVGSSDFRFKSNKSVTEFYDVKDYFLKTDFDYFISGNTYLSSELKYQSNNYVVNKTIDNDYYQALIGVKWSNSEITKVDMLVGYQDISFDNINLSNKKSFTWRLGIDWNPQEFITFRIASGRVYENTTQGINDYKIVDRYLLEVSYQIRDRWWLNTQSGYRNELIVSPISSRNNRYFYSNIELNYDWFDSLSLSLKHEFNKLNSDSTDEQYQRNVTSVNIIIKV